MTSLLLFYFLIFISIITNRDVYLTRQTVILCIIPNREVYLIYQTVIL